MDCDRVNFLLLSTDTETSSHPVPRKRRKWLRRVGILLLFFVLFLVWLNGPGVRWLLPQIAAHYLDKKSMAIEMKVRGSVTGGLTLHEIQLVGGPIVDLHMSDLELRYHWKELLDGKVRGIRVRGIKVEMDLDRKFPITSEPEPELPFDIRKVVEMLRTNQLLTSAYDVEARIEEMLIHRSDDLIASSKNLQLSHTAGQNYWKIESGEWQLSEKKNIPAQTVGITWLPDRLVIDQFRYDDTLRLENIQFSTPENFRPSLQLRLGFAESLFDLQTTEDFQRIDLLMTGKPWSLSQLQPYLTEPLPAQGNVTALTLRVEPENLPIFGDATPPPMLVDLNLQLKMQALQWQQWKLDEFDLTLSKAAEKGDLVARIEGYEGLVDAKAQVLWNQNPNAKEDWQRASVVYDVGIPELKNLLENLSPQLGIKRPLDAVAPPASALRALGSMRIDGSAIRPMDTQVDLKPLDEKLPPLRVTAQSPQGKNFTFEGVTGALQAKGTLDTEAMKYGAEVSVKELDPQVYQPWVAWAGITLPTGMNASVNWQGSGLIKEKQHAGEAMIEAFTWKRADSDDVTASGRVTYDWPRKADVENLQVNMGDQQARMNLTWADYRLELRELELRKSDQLLLRGTASIPVAESVKSAREFFQQTQEIKVSLNSEALPLATAEQWMKPGEKLPMTGTAKIDLQITGSPTEPAVSGNLQFKEVKSRAKSDLPALNLSVDLHTLPNKISLSGLLLTARTSPIQLKAEMPFRPGAWAEDVQLLEREKINARVDCPELDLARFQDLVPQVKQLAGTISGNVVIDGSVKAPRINGALAMKNFSTRLPNEKIPPITNGAMNLTFTDQLVKLEKLSLQLAGGNIVVQGVADLNEPKKPNLDFTLRGAALPLWRDDAVIARANANLRMAGPWDLVRTTGEIGMIDSLLYKDFEIIPIGKPFTLPQAASLPALDNKLENKANALPLPFANWPLAVTFKTTDPFLVRGNLARGSITSNIKVGGTWGNPQPVGEVVIEDLVAALPLSRLTVTSGKIRLTAATGLDPLLDIRGASRVSNYDVNIYVYGPASAPKILLSSEPPLPENEIMTLLATGTTTDGLTDPDAAQSKLTQLVIEEFRRGRLPLGRRLMPLLSKLENVELAVGEPDPYTGKKYASAKMPLFSRYFLYGAVDALGRTRTLFMFEVKMK